MTRAMGRVLNIIVATSPSQGIVMLLSGCCPFIPVFLLILVVVVVVDGSAGVSLLNLEE